MSLSTSQMVLLTLGTLYIVVWSVLYYTGARPAVRQMFDKLPKDDFPLGDVSFVGYVILDKLHYRYQSERDSKLRKEIAIVYEEKYVEYYLRMIRAQQATIASLMPAIGFIVYGMTQQIIMLPALAAVSVVGWNYYGGVVHEKIEKRSRELLRDFSEVVSELALLTNAGMVLRDAWSVVAHNGERLVYQEMRLVEEEIRNGTSERDAYYQFGVRCVIPEVKKFVSTILQGMSKGNSELSLMLQKQSEEIWNQKKQSVEQQVKKAESKLLLPMSLMFVGILILVIVPMVMGISF